MPSAESHKRRILITGVAGFIGFHLARRLLCDYGNDVEIVGIDNLNGVNATELQKDRLRELGVDAGCAGDEVRSSYFKGLEFIKMDIADAPAIDGLMDRYRFDVVVHLAARASARASAVDPRGYIESNIEGFLNVMDGCRRSGVKHLVFASSSSVYGMNDAVPYSEGSDASKPVSFYAATKRSNELMAYSYASMYGLPVTALRFFSVYGPWGRPDMAPYLFIDAVLRGNSVKVYNHGDMYRDFTYVDDVVEGIVRVIGVVPEVVPPFRVLNIGNSSPVRLTDFVKEIETATGVTASMEMLPMQSGDVYRTYADCTRLMELTGFTPSTSLCDGIGKTVSWFIEYYKIEK